MKLSKKLKRSKKYSKIRSKRKLKSKLKRKSKKLISDGNKFISRPGRIINNDISRPGRIINNDMENMALQELIYDKKQMITVRKHSSKYKLTKHSAMIFSEFDNMLEFDSLTQNTTDIFRFFYDKFREADEFMLHIDIDNHIYKNEKIKNIKEIPKTDDFTYIIPEIREHIENMARHKIIYKFPSLFERDIEFYFTVDKIDMDEINSFVYKMLLWLFVVTKLNNRPSCSRKLEIYIYLTDLIKCLPNNGEKIGKISINTGFTTSCSPESNITIYRREECFKVFIHESIHNLGLDFSGMNNQNTKNRMLKIFPVKSLVKAYEAYTDNWARIINVLICSYLMSPKKTFNEYIQNTEELINVERTYAYFQVVKILSHMGLVYEDLYKPGREKKRELYAEETSILAYYIIGLILLSDYEKFLVWCQKNNKSSILQFDNIPEKQEKFCDYVEHEYKNFKFLKTMKEIENIFENMKDMKDIKHTYILNNVRKSFCEFEIK